MFEQLWKHGAVLRSKCSSPLYLAQQTVIDGIRLALSVDMKLLAAVWGFGAYLATSLASAQTADDASSSRGTPAVKLLPQREAETPVARRWYGWKALSIDAGAAALSLTALGVATYDDSCDEDLAAALLLGAVAPYALGGPVFHLLSGDGRRELRLVGSF